jgi:hypothetical protein
LKFANIVKASALALAATLMVGCGEKVEVPPGHFAKLLTKDGYQEEMIPASKFRLPACVTYCDRLVVVDGTDRPYSEEMEIFIPSDKLKIGIQLKATLSVDPKRVNPLFGSLPQVAETTQFSNITAQSIYNTYAQQIMLAEVRAYLTQYTIAEITSNNDKINTDIQVILQKSMEKNTPFNVKYAGITKFSLPPIITQAQENSAKRREAIQQEEAQLAVSKVQLERELQEAKLQRQIEKEKAETESIKIQAQAQAVTSQTIRMKELEVEQIKAEKWDGKYPQTMVGSGTSMLMQLPASK